MGLCRSRVVASSTLLNLVVVVVETALLAVPARGLCGVGLGLYFFFELCKFAFELVELLVGVLHCLGRGLGDLWGCSWPIGFAAAAPFVASQVDMATGAFPGFFASTFALLLLLLVLGLEP